MAKIQNPLTGASRGKFSNAYFTRLFRKNILRSTPVKFVDRESAAQLSQRANLAAAGSFLKSILSFINYSFPVSLSGMPALSLCTPSVLLHASDAAGTDQLSTLNSLDNFNPINQSSVFSAGGAGVGSISIFADFSNYLSDILPNKQAAFTLYNCTLKSSSTHFFSVPVSGVIEEIISVPGWLHDHAIVCFAALLLPRRQSQLFKCIVPHDYFEITVTGQNIESHTNGTIVFSADQLLTVEATGDCTIISQLTNSDSTFIQHTITFTTSRDGAGTLIINNAALVRSLGNHRGYLDPTIAFYSGLPASAPVLSFDDLNLPHFLSKVRFTSLATIFPSISCPLSSFPPALSYLSLAGHNTISGSLADAPATLTYLYIRGSNIISGSLADAPAYLTSLRIEGSNSISGSLADAPADLNFLYMAGSNTISGSIADSPADLTYLLVYGSNTISGSLADAPTNLTYLSIGGSNIISGSLADAPAYLTYLRIEGNNIISGNIADVSADLTYLRILGLNTINDYTQGKTFANDFIQMTKTGTQGLPQSKLIDLIVDISAATWAVGGSIFNMGSPNASMADPKLPGIWMRDTDPPQLTDLGLAYKNLIKTKIVTVTLRDISMPGLTGDGIGFPEGFGDLFRS